MLQLIVAVLADEKDQTELSFIYENKTEDDVLLKYTLDRLEREHPSRFKVHYCISKETWAAEKKTGEEWSADRITYSRISLPIIEKYGFAANVTLKQILPAFTKICIVIVSAGNGNGV